MSAASKGMFNSEKATVKTVGNFMAFLLVLAPPPDQQDQEEAASSQFPPLGWKEQSKTYSLHYKLPIGCPKGLISVLPNLQLNEER